MKKISCMKDDFGCSACVLKKNCERLKIRMKNCGQTSWVFRCPMGAKKEKKDIKMLEKEEYIWKKNTRIGQ